MKTAEAKDEFIVSDSSHELKRQQQGTQQLTVKTDELDCSHSNICITDLTFRYAHARKLEQNRPPVQQHNCFGAFRTETLPFLAQKRGIMEGIISDL